MSSFKDRDGEDHNLLSKSADGSPMPPRPKSGSFIDEFADRRLSKIHETLPLELQKITERKFRCRLGTDNILLIFTVSSVIIGILMGLGIRKADPTFGSRQRETMYLKFPGEIFLRMLKMCILPLIVSSLISSLASLQSSTAGRLGLYALVYYTTTTFIAVIIGISLSLTIQPGTWSAATTKDDSNEKTPCISKAVDTILDLLRNLFPDNLAEATMHSLKTCSQFSRLIGNDSTILTPKEAISLSPAQPQTRQIQHNRRIRFWIQWSINNEERDILDDKPVAQNTDGMNILGLVTFSILFGFIISKMGEEGKPLLKFFSALEGAMMRLIALVIWYSPIGISFLIAAQIVEMEDPSKELKRLSGYMLTVILGLFIHGVIVLPLLLIALGRRNPLKYAYGMMQALLTALGTSSSSATLPLSIKCLEENCGIDPRVTRFMLPLGATINMDGTALYEAVAALYIAQTVGKEMSAGSVIMISLTATLASVGAAGIPQAGVVTMIMVLIAIGLPTKYFVLIMPVDWFLDRIRTTVNVHGDSIGAGIVNRLCASQLRDETLQMQEREANHQTNARAYHSMDVNAEVAVI